VNYLLGKDSNLKLFLFLEVFCLLIGNFKYLLLLVQPAISDFLVRFKLMDIFYLCLIIFVFWYSSYLLFEIHDLSPHCFAILDYFFHLVNLLSSDIRGTLYAFLFGKLIGIFIKVLFHHLDFEFHLINFLGCDFVSPCVSSTELLDGICHVFHHVTIKLLTVLNSQICFSFKF